MHGLQFCRTSDLAESLNIAKSGRGEWAVEEGGGVGEEWLRSWDGCVHDGLWNMHGWRSSVAEATAKSSWLGPAACGPLALHRMAGSGSPKQLLSLATLLRSIVLENSGVAPLQGWR